MAVIGVCALLISAYNSNKSKELNTVVEKKVDNLGVPFVKNSRGEFIALPDSTVIRFFPNDSLTYTIIKNK
jgi:hypothetical protein